MKVMKTPRSKRAKEKETLLDTIRRMRQSRMREIHASVSVERGTARSGYGYGYGPFWNCTSLVLLRRERFAR